MVADPVSGTSQVILARADPWWSNEKSRNTRVGPALAGGSQVMTTESPSFTGRGVAGIFRAAIPNPLSEKGP